MIKRTIVTLFALIGSATAQNNSGVKASLDVAILEQAKNVYMDTILNTLNNLALPDFGDSKDYLHGNHIEVSQSA